MKSFRHVALFLFALCAFAGLAAAQDSPAPPPTTSQQLESLRAAIFQPATPAVPASGEGVRPLTPAAPGAQAFDECSAGPCFQFVCSCREVCAPCGIAQVSCFPRTCVCNSPC